MRQPPQDSQMLASDVRRTSDKFATYCSHPSFGCRSWIRKDGFSQRAITLPQKIDLRSSCNELFAACPVVWFETGSPTFRNYGLLPCGQLLIIGHRGPKSDTSFNVVRRCWKGLLQRTAFCPPLEQVVCHKDGKTGAGKRQRALNSCELFPNRSKRAGQSWPGVDAGIGLQKASRPCGSAYTVRSR
jgi:hypothetical protein